MKTRYFLLMLMAMLVTVGAQAEDIVQVKPFSTTKGVAKSDKKSFYVEMCNTTPVLSVEFKIFLPAGMEITRTAAVSARVPRDTDWDENYYTCQSNKQEDGSYKVVLVNITNKENITGTSGAVIQVYYQTSDDMADGIYPITVSDVVVGDINSQPIAQTAETSSSYVSIGEASPITTNKDLDLNNVLTGYLPSFVVTQLNADMADNENLRSLKLAEATFGEELTIPENVVYQVGTTGGLKRSFPASQKSTVCLPFALSEDQVSAVKEKGCEVEQFSGYNASKSSVSFEAVSAMTANTPYLVTVTAAEAQTLFDGLTDVDADLSAGPVDVPQGDMTFKGSYEKTTISSDDNTTYYAYDASDGAFVRVGSNATVIPYRAYLALSGTASAARLVIDDKATGIDNVNVNGNDNDNDNKIEEYFDLQGRRIARPVGKGLYIKGNRKYVGK